MAESMLRHIYNGYAAKEAGREQEAFDCFSKALELEPDSPIAAYEVGCAYEDGKLVAKDLAKAFTLYEQAAEGCVALAQEKLAHWYEQGIHVAKDSKAAAHWKERAGAQAELDMQPPMTLAESITQAVAEKQNEMNSGKSDKN